MKYLGIVLLFTLWGIITILLSITLIGIIAVSVLDENAIWFSIPNKLINKL